MPYIPFTEEQKLKAASVDIPAFLIKKGMELEKSGHEFRLKGDPYITVNGNQWFDQAEQRGGNAISLVRKLYDLGYPEAVTMLLEGQMDAAPDIGGRSSQKEKKPFALPPRHSDMRRVYAYLIRQRQIPVEIISHFAKNKMLYESAEPNPKNGKVYHNAVFVGCDEHGVPRHAHKRGLASIGTTYRGNVEGSDPGYSFRQIGTSNTVYAFEAPIDMLSFIALYPNNWERHSYVALCGVAEHALMRILYEKPVITEVCLCLDNDERGIQATDSLRSKLAARDEVATKILLPENKDWNVDLQQAHGARREYLCGMDGADVAQAPTHSMT